jgi:hypothetical protein
MNKQKECLMCDLSEESLKNCYNFLLVQCCHCKKYFCEGCLVDGQYCPKCSDLVEFY